jgi:hypothetical protein
LTAIVNDSAIANRQSSTKSTIPNPQSAIQVSPHTPV